MANTNNPVQKKSFVLWRGLSAFGARQLDLQDVQMRDAISEWARQCKEKYAVGHWLQGVTAYDLCNKGVTASDLNDMLYTQHCKVLSRPKTERRAAKKRIDTFEAIILMLLRELRELHELRVLHKYTPPLIYEKSACI